MSSTAAIKQAPSKAAIEGMLQDLSDCAAQVQYDLGEDRLDVEVCRADWLDAYHVASALYDKLEDLRMRAFRITNERGPGY